MKTKLIPLVFSVLITFAILPSTNFDSNGDGVRGGRKGADGVRGNFKSDGATLGKISLSKNGFERGLTHYTQGHGAGSGAH